MIGSHPLARLAHKRVNYFTAALACAMLWPTTLPAQEKTTNPFEDPIPKGDLSVGIEPFADLSNPGDTESVRANILTPLGDGSGRSLVNDQRGPLSIVESDGSTHEYLDLRDPDLGAPAFTGGEIELGFQGVAADPDFEQNGKFYTSYSSSDTSRATDFPDPKAGTSHEGVVVEWTADDPEAETFSGTARELFRVEENFEHHNLGQVGFNPNAQKGDDDYGNLYVAAGDGGGQSFGPPNGQDTDTATGSILRIDPQGDNSDNGRYGVPADNPSVNDGDADDSDVEEIYAYGFRNPQRFSFDTGGDHEMFVGDIGENVVEEINIIEPGGNYGWTRREGSFVHTKFELVRPVLPSEEDPSLIGPVAEYDHTEGAAVTAGYVYRGSMVPELEGKFLFGDIRNGRIFYIDADRPGELDGGQVDIQELRLVEDGQEKSLRELIRGEDTGRADLRFGMGPDGEIYILNKHDGIIRRLVSLDPPGNIENPTDEPGDSDSPDDSDELSPTITAVPTPSVFAAAALGLMLLIFVRPMSIPSRSSE